MECERLPAPATWDQETPDKLKQYRLHIQFCSSCRAIVRAEAPDQLLFEMQSAPLPDDFWLGFWNSVRQKAAIQADSGARVQNRTRPNIYHPIRWVAVFVIGLFVLLYGRNLPESPPVRPIQSESYPVVERIENPEARYYIFQSGDQEKIVMVFDPAMEL